MRVRKVVITAAGWGTRFLPATKVQPKEMFPLVDKPIIQFVVEEALAAGIEQIIVVTAGGKRAIEDHFDRSFGLERALTRKGDANRLAMVRSIGSLANISYVRQAEQLGLGHAILRARDLVGDEPFAVILPDDIVASDTPALKQLIDVFDRFQRSVLAVERVPRVEASSYGIIAARPLADRLFQVQGLVEKPEPADAPSDLAIVGRYIMTPEVFDLIAETPAGRLGEIQITDALARLVEQQPIYAYELEGRRFDTGTPIGYLKASIEFALGRPDLSEVLRSFLLRLLTRPGENVHPWPAPGPVSTDPERVLTPAGAQPEEDDWSALPTRRRARWVPPEL
jgi:UTP--glucose-1-phosphate uridylyltransferase